MKLGKLKIFNYHLSMPQRIDVLIVDFLPHKRTILFQDSNLLHLQMPYLRFALGVSNYSKLQWNGHLWLWGSAQSFEENSLGFAMPLPNMDGQGYLTCTGTMPIEVNPVEAIESFWSSSFTYYAAMPKSLRNTKLGRQLGAERPDGRFGPGAVNFYISNLKGIEQEVYRNLVGVDGGTLTELRDVGE